MDILQPFLRSEGEMGRRIAEFDWSSHPLGPLELWPASLRTAVSLILNSRHPMWVGWGERMSFFYNDAYLHVLGTAKHRWALGRPAEEVWAEIWDVCGPLADKVFREGEASFVDDVRLFMNRGDYLEETFYSFSYSPIREDSGRVAGLFCPSNDVTPKVVGARRLVTLSQLAADALAQKSIEAACRAAAATLATNPDDVPFALLYVLDGNDAKLEQTVGISRGMIEPLISPAVRGAIETGRARRLSMRNMIDGPQYADRPIAEAIIMPVAGRAEAGAHGALVAGINPTRPFDKEHAAFFELVASNIGTAIQNARASEEEKKRIELLAEMDRAKTAFFSNVSHEFRTPLTLMLGPLEQIAQSPDERDRALAQTARRNALRLLKLVNVLLEFSRLEAGRNDATFVPVDLSALTRDVASSFRSAIESTGLRFKVETPLDETVFVDPSMWERIVLNLLSNALKFTFEGEIAVSLRKNGEFAELSVSDTGVGISPADLPHLFERFHRVRGAKSRTHEGTGIGLALVRDLTGLHHGSVDVESAVGDGTTFHVRIPLGSAHLDQQRIGTPQPAAFSSSVEQYLADIDATVARSGSQIAASSPAASGRSRILVADDNADLREYVGGILSARYEVTAVKNGREALDKVQRERFDLIVSDVMMPEMDGFELLRAVRTDDRLAPTPFIMLSARAGEEAAHEGLLHGADDYIAKPFSAEELIVRVHAQINAASLRERATQELRASEARFRSLAASLPYMVFEADPQGAITYLSDEYSAYTGHPVEPPDAVEWTNVIHPEDYPSARERWLAAMASGEPFSFEYRIRHRDGHYRWFASRALPQRDAAGRIYRWTGTIADVHDQRQAARERDLLARASDILAQPLDIDETLQAVASFAVPEIADWCEIDLRTDDGRIRTAAIAHRDPQKERLAQQLLGRIHINPEGGHGTNDVFATGESQLVEDVHVDGYTEVEGDAEAIELCRELGFTSWVSVPLVAESTTLGVLSVVCGSSQRRYSKDDVPLLEEFGRRAGLAIHKARLFEREHRAAESFQQASLPKTLPHAPGLRLDAFYAPGRAEAQVGGDWYDAVRLVDGRLVISIGDVAGSGLDAAVTMGNMRQIIRGIAQVHADPALMLDAADRALRLEHPEKFVTAFVGVFDVITGTLTYASAGHPPPLVRTSDGSVNPLKDVGLPLGLRMNGLTHRSKSIEMRPGSTFVFYTDGLTEFERAPDRGEARLQEVLADPSLSWASNPAKTIVQRMTNNSEARDDVAVLVLHVDETLATGLLQEWSFDNGNAQAAGGVRSSFAQAFRERGGSSEDVATAEIVLGELISNTVRYAPGFVRTIVDWSGPDPVLHVLDEGPGFRHISILPPDLMSESGRGLFIVSALTHDLRVSKRPGGGSHARAVLRIQKRHLFNGHVDAFSGSLVSALDNPIGGILD